MNAIAWVTAIALLIGFGMAGLAKITKQQMLMDSAAHLGFSPSQYQLIGVAEAVGAIGVLFGRLVDDLSGLGLLAAIGLTLVGLGALFFHVRAKDTPKDMVPAGALTGLAIFHIIAIA